MFWTIHLVTLKYFRITFIFDCAKKCCVASKILTYDMTTECKSLMNNKNNSGPNTLPWGILLDILAHFDFAECKTTPYL